MKYFFVSGYVSGRPFSESLRSENGYPQRDAVIEFIQERSGISGEVVIMNITEMNAVDYTNWNLPLK